MYAIVQTKGFQIRMEPENTVRVPKLDGEPGEEVKLENVLMCRDGDTIFMGQPFIKGAIVRASIVSHERGKKVRGLKFKRRKNYRRHWGHRQDYTLLRIEELSLPKDLQ